MTQYKQNKLISKILVEYNFVFTSYAWLCVLYCSTDYYVVYKCKWKMLLFHNETISVFGVVVNVVLIYK